jgi:hypothetical protein
MNYTDSNEKFNRKRKIIGVERSLELREVPREWSGICRVVLAALHGLAHIR